MHQVKIYTDGSCIGNPGPAGCAALLLHFKDGAVVNRKIVERYLGFATNQVAELHAVIVGLKEVKKPADVEVELCTDSQYVINMLGNCTARANLETVQTMRDLAKTFPKIKITKVKAHGNDPFNKYIDKIAYQAALRKK